MSSVSVLETIKTTGSKRFSQYSIVKEYIIMHKTLGAVFKFNSLYMEILSQYPVNVTYSGVSSSLSRMEKLGYLEFINSTLGYKFIDRDPSGRTKSKKDEIWEVPEPIVQLCAVMQQWISSSDTSYPETTYRANQCTLSTWLVCLTQIWKARRNREIKCSLPSSLNSHNVVRAVSSNPRFGD